MSIDRSWLCFAAIILAFGFASVMADNVSAQASGKKPNILVIWGDDIGYWNVSMNNLGMMGYKTPNIDRTAKETLQKGGGNK